MAAEIWGWENVWKYNNLMLFLSNLNIHGFVKEEEDDTV